MNVLKKIVYGTKDAKGLIKYYNPFRICIYMIILYKDVVDAHTFQRI